MQFKLIPVYREQLFHGFIYVTDQSNNRNIQPALKNFTGAYLGIN